MSKPAFREAEWDEDAEYSDDKSVLLGPDGWRCSLGESEDRTWGRDGSPVVALLNRQHAEIARLTAELAAARAVTAGVCRYLDCAASNLLAVVTSLYESRARAISDATDARGTVGGLLATAPVGSIVEFFDDQRPCWYQVRVSKTGSLDSRAHWRRAWTPWRTDCDISGDIRAEAHLVPAAEADADPNQRGPLPKGG